MSEGVAVPLAAVEAGWEKAADGLVDLFCGGVGEGADAARTDACGSDAIGLGPGEGVGADHEGGAVVVLFDDEEGFRV